jgi:predicted alpha/beta-hydrolase family hydrolase
MFGQAIYLGGGSYPACADVEEAVRGRLAPLFGTWTGQGDINRRFGPSERVGSLEKRLRRLGRMLPSGEARRDVVLIGRSAGGRIATVVAAEAPVAAVICLGYPFRHPDEEPDPARVVHLAGLATPTLIVQGRADPYGGEATARETLLSPAIRVHFVDAGHTLKLTSADWDAAATVMRDFLTSVAAEAAQPLP